MPIQVPGSSSGRTPYGGTPADIVTTLDAEGDLVPYQASMSAWDSPEGGVQLTDLQDMTGAPIASVTQPAALDPIRFFGPPDYTGPIWVQTTITLNGVPRNIRWQINPSDLATRSGGGVTWTTIAGKPAVVAAGGTAEEARAAIGALSSSYSPTKASVGLGNVDNTSDATKPVSSAQQAAITNAVNAAVEQARDRSTHRGIQSASTIGNFEDEVRRIYALITGTPGTPPPASTGAPLDVSASGSTTSPYAITIEWEAPTDTGGKTVAGYDVFRDNPDWNRGTPLAASDRSFTFSNFNTGTAYKVAVQTVFTDGTKSPWAYAPNTITFASTTPTPTDPPPIVTDPGGTTSSAPMPYPAHAVAAYHMCWTNSGSPRLAATPANINVLRLAFVQGNPPVITGPASEGDMATFGAELKKLRARGVRIMLSIGGQHGTANISNRSGVVQSVINFSNTVCPVDGFDWDLEGPAMGAEDVRQICRSLKQQRGANFSFSMAPSGGDPVQTYLNAAVLMNQDGNAPYFGQQFYDSAVSEGDMMGRLAEYVGRGLPISRYELGMMHYISGRSLHPPTHYWDLATCVSRLNAAKARYPTFGGAYYWEASRPNYGAWASTIGNIIKTW